MGKEKQEKRCRGTLWPAWCRSRGLALFPPALCLLATTRRPSKVVTTPEVICPARWRLSSHRDRTEQNRTHCPPQDPPALPRAPATLPACAATVAVIWVLLCHGSKGSQVLTGNDVVTPHSRQGEGGKPRRHDAWGYGATVEQSYFSPASGLGWSSDKRMCCGWAADRDSWNATWVLSSKRGEAPLLPH